MASYLPIWAYNLSAYPRTDVRHRLVFQVYIGKLKVSPSNNSSTEATVIGGKPRKPNKREDFEPSKRGRGTSKTSVIGAVARGGEVVAEVAKGLTGRHILEFIRRVVNVRESELMTDEYHA